MHRADDPPLAPFYGCVIGGLARGPRVQAISSLYLVVYKNHQSIYSYRTIDPERCFPIEMKEILAWPKTFVRL